jgi:UDP-GlcNAc:undecaprenyl-phosphate GlcNAc-1-phosphate transferase
MRLTTYFPTILAAILISFFSSPLGIAVANRVGLVDQPGGSAHKRHVSPTPMAGGMVITLTLLVMAIILGWFTSPLILGMLVGTFVIFLFGVMDDRIGFGVPQKLFGQFLATAILIFTGTQIRLFSNNAANLVLTVFWVVGIVNAFNFVDSMDGLALGLAGIAASFFLLVTIEAGQPMIAAISAGVLGACIGTAFYNLPPAKMFLGDSGAQQLGFLMASIGVAYNPVGLPKLSSWYVPILVLGVPILDTSLVFFSRLRRGLRVYRASHDHIFHRLCKLGLEPTRSVFTMHLIGMVLGFISFIALNTSYLVGNGIFAMAILGGIMIIVVFERRNLLG